MAFPSLRPNVRRFAIEFIALVVVASFLAASGPAAAASPNYLAGSACTGGNLNPAWKTGDTWILYGNVTVPSGCVLTIEPGAIVRANAAVHLYVTGQLLANGTATSLITFDTNGTGVPWTWGGVQFNQSKTQSFLQHASLHQADRAIRAVRASPAISFDLVDRAVVGVSLEDSSASVTGSTIDYTMMAVRINGSLSSPAISTNQIRVVAANPAIAISIDQAGAPSITFNTIRWVNGTAGAAGPSPGVRGQDGGLAIALYVNGTRFPSLSVNTITEVNGGRGGNGAAALLGSGPVGGNGGGAVAIVAANSPISQVQSNTVTQVHGGLGGTGGAAGTGGTGGVGGAGGSAVAVETIGVTSSALWTSNTIQYVLGGSGGDAGSLGTAASGNGGAGGDAYGFFAGTTMNGNATGNAVHDLTGGYSGNGSRGGRPGQAGGFFLFGVDGSLLVQSNTFGRLRGGTASNYLAPGGNATGILVAGDGVVQNLTRILSNTVTGVTGGAASLGGNPAASGGPVTGIGALSVRLQSSGNLVQNLVGGTGGGTTNGNTNGQGGPAVGWVAALLSGTSSLDRVQSVAGGAGGVGGNPNAPSLGLGLYAAGGRAVTSRLQVTNGSFSSIGTLDLFLDNYSATTTLNTTFASSKIAVQNAANLTVKNFLAVNAYWPNGKTLVGGVTVTVTDNAVPVFSRALPSGTVSWIPVTNRVYTDRSLPSWNATVAAVAFLSYGFAGNNRAVNLTASQTQNFTMIDSSVPYSAAAPLPTWTGTRSFSVRYNYTDGNGTGVANITLWSNLNGTGWVQSGTALPTTTSSGTGAFTFAAPSDGVYQFATTAYDNAGLHQPFPPIANNTWTIVDTRVPASRVSALPTWETSLAFKVAWGPLNAETDIAFYTIQYLHGSTWTTWLADTTLRSQTFNISALGILSPDGTYAFRSIAHTYAGITEAKTANDTWTIVDTVPPISSVGILTRYQTSVAFPITWGPTSGTVDASNYTLQFSTDGGPWTTWFSAATNASATFAGRDGHRYAFRSLAKDFAGNVESKTGNDTWTIVDTTPPSTSVSALPRYEPSVSFGVYWVPRTGTTDVVSYAVQVSLDGGGWVTWFSGATNLSATFTGRDGHVYAFRSLGTDAAGNVEAKTANDTWTIVDTTPPYVVTDAPEGSGVDAGASITITFSEPMQEATVVQAFSITPTINGNFSWNTAGTVLTFVPARPLQAGTAYAITISTSAKDLAGNGLASPKTFLFTTSGSASTLGLDPLWILVAVVAVAGLATAVFLLRRRSAAEGPAEAARPAASSAASPAPPTEIDDVFLLYKDGILIKHETLRLRPDIDTDILSGMLTAVQQFVKDSFQVEDGAELNEITVGQMHLHIGRGKWLILAARLAGGDVATMNEQIRKCLEDMEQHHWDQLEDWDGDMALARILGPYLKKLIRGDYV